MRSKFALLLLFASVSAVAQVDRSPMKIKTPPPAFDLIQENNSIHVFAEDSVQREEPESRHVINFAVGQVSASSLELSSNGQIVNYDLTQPATSFGAGLGYYPFHWNGYLGLLSAVNYSYREQVNRFAPSALHLVGGDVLVSYRYEPSSHAWVKPFAGVGPGMNVVIQRGVDELNTSEAKGLWVATIGAGLNIKRVFDLSSPLDWEITAQYKRWIDPKPSNADYNGSLITVGLSMLL